MGVLHVGELLSLPVLRGARVLAGHRGLDREVTNVNVMEVPDIEAYVHPGEVLLTTLYPLRDDLARVAELVRRLHAAALSALVVRLGRYVDHIPAAAVDAADELGFPIIVVDTHIAFNDVISAVLAIVLADYGPEPGRAETIRERLTAVALTGGGLAEIARTLAGALDRHVTVVDAGGVTLGTGRPPTEPAGAAWSAADPSWAFPITVAGTERGRLLVDGNTEPTLGQRRLIRQACFAAGMHIAQALASIELDRRMRVLLLEEAVTGSSLDHGQLPERSRLFGWDFTGPHAVVLARAARELPGRRCRQDGGRGAARRRVGVVAGHRGGRDRAADRCRSGRGSRRGSIDGGRPWPRGPVRRARGHRHDRSDADGLAASHRSARESLAIGVVTARPLVRHDELLLERILLSVDPTRLAELVSDQIGPLIEADRTGSGALSRPWRPTSGSATPPRRPAALHPLQHDEAPHGADRRATRRRSARSAPVCRWPLPSPRAH